jgi:hypothetical protein
MSFWVNLDNLSFCFYYNFQLKGIKRNALINVIEFYFILFDGKKCLHLCLIMFIKCIWLDHTWNKEFWKLHNSFQKGCNENDYFFDHLVDCLCSLGLEFVAPNVSHIYVGNNHAKHVKLSIKTHVFFSTFLVCHKNIDA